MRWPLVIQFVQHPRVGIPGLIQDRAQQFGQIDRRHQLGGARIPPKGESRGNHGLQFLWLRIGKIPGCLIFFKQRWSHHVHPLVGALGREDRRDEELQRRAEIEFAMSRRIDLPEGVHEGGGALPPVP